MPTPTCRRHRASTNAAATPSISQDLSRQRTEQVVIGSGSHFSWATGRRSVDEAVKDAIGFCTPVTAAKCTVVNINNEPVE
jgi:hypothetical protein